MTTKFHIPQYPLRRFVKSMFWYEGYSGISKYEMILPDTNNLLAIELDGNQRFVSKDINCKNHFSALKNSWIQGLHTQPLFFQSEQNASTFCIQFELSGLHKLLDVPANELTNNIFNSEEFFGNEIIELRERICESPTFEERVKIIEKYLLLKFDSKLNESCSIGNITSLSNFAGLTLEEICKKLNFSKKHTIAIFHKNYGLTPKKLQILQSVNKSLQIFNKPKLFPTAQTAIECNHFDQSHFIKNFKLITSLTPQQYLNQHRIYPHVLSAN